MIALEELQEIFRSVFDDDSLIISRETTADDIDDWDSLAHIELVSNIEKKFSVKFTMVEVMSLENVGEFLDLLNEKVGK
ncbi:MAG: acyl carrier protein [Selenomonadaceae bacterium]|nr:acyl carrier protein [Selenomonadaceae bacterium]